MRDTDWTVLVPVEVLEGETVAAAVAELLATVPVVVLGYHVPPEQTAPGQARLQFEARAQSTLDDLAATFADAGGDADTRLVFTHDAEETIDRVAAETGCNAVLLLNPAPAVERLLVPVGGGVNVPRIAAFVATLIGDRDIAVTLLHVAPDEEAGAVADDLLAAARTHLRDGGVPDAAIETVTAVSAAPIETIATTAADYDAIVMGESQPSLRSFLFGDPSDRVAAYSLGPVLVVRRPPAPDAE
jgi:nucleotide-binding universal stress UspA family protein